MEWDKDRKEMQINGNPEQTDELRSEPWLGLCMRGYVYVEHSCFNEYIWATKRKEKRNIKERGIIV